MEGAIIISILVTCIAVFGWLYFYIQEKHNKKGIAGA